MKNWYFLTGLIITITLLWPLFAAPFFTHHDDVQIIRLHQMDKCIWDGQLPCRWVPDLGGEYGYPLFNYYAPLPYYYGEVFYLLTRNLIFSVKIMFATTIVASFIFMYLLGRKLWGEREGLFAGIFYSFVPYHAVDLYVRGAMGELWGLMLFPAILWSFLRLKERTNILNTMLFGLILALLIVSHNLSALIFIPIVLTFIGFNYLNDRNLKTIGFSFLGFVLAFILSSFYFLPVTFEKDLVHVETTTFGYFSYTEHFKGVKKLFIERNWGWGASVREVPGGEKDGMSFQIGVVHILFWILALISLKLLWKKDKMTSRLILFSSILILFSVFLINPRSKWFWDLIPSMKFIQFPWRFLMVIAFFISLIAPTILIASNQKFQKWFLIGGITLVVLLNFFYFRPERFLNVDERELLTGERWDRQIKRSIFDYLPKAAKEPPAELATTRYQILAGETYILDFEEKSNLIKFESDTRSHTILRLSQYYFPNWKIFIDGKETKVDYENTLGLMTIILGVGHHNVEVKLFDTPIRTLGNTLTGFGIIIYLILLPFIFKKSRGFMGYYIRALRR